MKSYIEVSKMGGYQARQKNKNETLLWDKKREFVEFSNDKKAVINGRPLKFDKNGKLVK